MEQSDGASPGAPRLKAINVRVISHEHHRYDTLGDWWFRTYYDFLDEQTWEVLEVRVSDMADERSTQAVALHEITEALLCRAHGVPEYAVMDYDLKCDPSLEPGEQPDAPYFMEHASAEVVEREFVKDSGLGWHQYEKDIATLADREGASCSVNWERQGSI